MVVVAIVLVPVAIAYVGGCSCVVVEVLLCSVSRGSLRKVWFVGLLFWDVPDVVLKLRLIPEIGVLRIC